MGMYDDLEYEGNSYQTKDFDCMMENYKIENGRLLLDSGHYIDTPQSEKPYPDAPKGDLMYFMGSVKWIHEAWKDMNFHGILRAHGDDGYVLFKFTDGQLVSVTPATLETES